MNSSGELGKQLNDAKNFSNALGLAGTETPFPWQDKLLASFNAGISARTSLDIPTGLGKTSVMAAWLVARSQGAPLPRRLVYVVDRRVVVDQATREAERLRDWLNETPAAKTALGLASDKSLPISTLRGQFVDNREWLEDPTAPAIIVGTVDMIGSRLLFEGYGVTRRMRPYHAGMLGSDVLFILDEAHLVPPFELMLETLVTNQDDFGARAGGGDIIPKLKLFSLSATGRSVAGEVWRLTEADREHEVAKQRLEATKRLRFRESDGAMSLAELLAEEAWHLADCGRKAVRIIVFSNSRDVAEKAQAATKKLRTAEAKRNAECMAVKTELLVGARRVRERNDAAESLGDLGFLAGDPSVPDQPTFLFATSAGEVGVDLDADHMVCDLVQWERMVQRMGRVNRRGHGQAEVRVVIEWETPTQVQSKALRKPADDRNSSETTAAQKYAAVVATRRDDPNHEVNVLKAPLQRLAARDDGHDASPLALQTLKLKADEDERLQSIIAAATSPIPLRPELTRAVVDAWSMTSLKEHTGRPSVAPWLRGWVESKPQSDVVWRRHMPTFEESGDDTKAQFASAAEFFEHAPPHLSEKLETDTWRVLEWLTKRAKTVLNEVVGASVADEGEDRRTALQPDSVIGVVVGPALSVVRFVSLKSLDFKERDKKVFKRQQDELQRDLSHNTLVIDARFGGLSESGLLDAGTTFEHSTFGDDADWVATAFRVHISDADDHADKAQWRVCRRFATRVSDLDEPKSWLVVEKRSGTSTSEDARAVAKTTQALVEHQQWAAEEAKRIADGLNLPSEYAGVLKVAARLHDAGKESARWQNAFSAPVEGRPYAKTLGPVMPARLDGYRHEFGSLQSIVADPDFQALQPDLQDLALHIVAAHHGYGRPVIRSSGCDDAPPSALADRARDVALRFARLQRQWGPWGLAWWESLLRAADQRASQRLDEFNGNPPSGATHG